MLVMARKGSLPYTTVYAEKEKKEPKTRQGLWGESVFPGPNIMLMFSTSKTGEREGKYIVGSSFPENEVTRKLSWPFIFFCCR